MMCATEDVYRHSPLSTVYTLTRHSVCISYLRNVQNYTIFRVRQCHSFVQKLHCILYLRELR